MGRRRNPVFAPRERDIQASLLEYWRVLGVAGSLVAACPNAHSHGQAGLTPGLFDLVVLSPKLGDRTGWLELKRSDGKLSTAQNTFRLMLIALGAPYTVAYGIDQAIRALEEWGAVRPQARAAA